MFFDPTYLVLIPALILAFWAQAKVKSAFNTYSQVPSSRGVTAEMAARELLNRFGLTNVPIQQIEGNLTDHYDPSKKSLSLSESVYGETSIAAIGVAAHEVGHAVQDKEGYMFLRLRNAIVPAVNLCNTASIPLFFIGFLFRGTTLMTIGILLFAGVLAFHVITLPVEFDASNRALRVLGETGMLTSAELGGAKKVLNAAAMTYISATLMAVSQLVRLIILRNRRSD